MMAMGMSDANNNYDGQSTGEDEGSNSPNRYGNSQKNGGNSKQQSYDQKQQSSVGYGNQGQKYEEPQVSLWMHKATF